MRYNEDYQWKLNETHDLMLEKIIKVSCCEPCEEETVDESLCKQTFIKRDKELNSTL